MDPGRSEGGPETNASDETIEKLRVANQALRQQLKEFSRALDASLAQNQDMSTASSKASASDGRRKDMISALSSKEKQLKALHKKMEIYKRANSELKKQLGSSYHPEKLAQLKNEKREKEIEIEQLKAENKSLLIVQRNQTKQIEKQEDMKTQWPAKVSSLMADLRVAKDKLRRAKEHEAKVEQDSRKLHEQMARVTKKNKSLQNQLAQYERQGGSSAGDKAKRKLMAQWKQEKEKLEHSIEVLEHSKQQERTKGERLLRANMAELQKVKKEMERHKQQLDEKEKEIRLQVLQVKKLRRQLRELALGGGDGDKPRSSWGAGGKGEEDDFGADSRSANYAQGKPSSNHNSSARKDDDGYDKSYDNDNEFKSEGGRRGGRGGGRLHKAPRQGSRKELRKLQPSGSKSRLRKPRKAGRGGKGSPGQKRDSPQRRQRQQQQQKKQQQHEESKISTPRRSGSKRGMKKTPGSSGAKQTPGSVNKRSPVARQVAAKPEIGEDGAATRIQASYRGRKARKDLAEQHEAATRVQKLYKGHSKHNLIKKQNHAATKVQAHVRGRQGRKAYKAKAKARDPNVAATKIQAIHRGNTARRELAEADEPEPYREPSEQELEDGAVALQSAYRSFRVRKEVDVVRKEKTEAVVKVQATVRGHQARAEVRQIRGDRQRQKARNFVSGAPLSARGGSSRRVR